MADGAPVCNLPNQGQVPALQAGIRLPHIPPAHDLPSALRAAAALIGTINQMLNDPPQNNLQPFTAVSLSPAGGGTSGITNSFASGPAAEKGQDGKDAKKVRFEESSREVQHVKVVNPDDDDQYVFVERIVSVSFYDNETGGSFYWEGVNLG